MKKLITLMIFLASSNSFAMNDIERAILFGINSASGGTFLPVMEAEKEKIKLEYEKKKAEFELQLEKDHQHNLSGLIDVEIKLLSDFQKANEDRLKIAINQQNNFAKIVHLTESLYDSTASINEVISEIAVRAEDDPTIKERWAELLQAANVSIEYRDLSSKNIQSLLESAYEINMQYQTMIENYTSQISQIKDQIKSLQKRKEGLK